MLWFILCSIPGMVIGAGLHIAGHPLSLEYGILAMVAFGLIGGAYCTRKPRRIRR